MHWTVLMLAAALAAPAGDVKRAAQLEAWGDLAEARAEIEVALARDAKDPGAALVAACLDLEEGKLEAAKARASAPPLAALPQGKVLRALVGRRRAHPEEKLRDALAPAWKAAGRPDLAGGVVPGVEAQGWTDGADREIPDASRAIMTPGERVIFAAWIHGELHADALAAAAHPENNPSSVNHEILGALRRGEEPFDEEEAAAVARVGKVLVAADPNNGYWAVAAWAQSSTPTTPLDAADVALLARAAARPQFAFPRDRLLQELRSIAARFDSRHARCRASLAGLGLGAPLGFLSARAKATQWDGPDGHVLRRRTAAVSNAIGRRLARSRTYLERLVGEQLVATGATLTEDERPAGEARGHAEAARERYRRAEQASRSAGAWPFSSACADWSPDEVTHFERYLD